MWVVFRKSDKRVIGTSAHSTEDIDKAVALEEVVASMAPGEDLTDFDALQVPDPEQVPGLTGRRGRSRLLVKEDAEGKPQVAARPLETFYLSLEPQVGERHPVDDLPILPADGESTAEIVVRKIDREGKPLTRSGDDDRLWLRTDAGALLDGREQPIRSLRLSRGEAVFQLRSDNAPRVATVRLFTTNPLLEGGSVQVEFAPPETILDERPKEPVAIESLAIPERQKEDLQRAVEVLRGHGTKEIHLYGSLATGAIHEDSDIDLAIRGFPKGQLDAIRAELTTTLGRRIDVLDLDDKTPLARHLRITGRLLRVG